MTEHRAKIRRGDVFAIRLSDNLLAAALILHISRTFRSGMIIGIFDHAFGSEEEITVDRLKNIRFIDTPNYTTTRPIKSGRWRIICSQPTLLLEHPMPELRVAYSVYLGDEVVRDGIPLDDFDKYPQLTVSGYLLVESTLKDYFNQRRRRKQKTRRR